jgi:HlyB family type I secretion system ABC transporter
MTDSLQDALANLVMFRSLSPALKQLVADSFIPQSFSFGGNVVSEGEEATAFYIIVAGRAQVIKRGLQDEEIVLNVLHPGDNFGKGALLETTKRQAAVRAISDLKLFKLERQVFQSLIRSHPELKVHIDLQIKHRSLSDFFRLYTPFAKLPVAALTMLLQELEPVTVKGGDLVIRQDDPSGPLYIVEEGHLRAFIEKEGQRHYRRDLRKGDFFGEVSLFQNSPRTASVEAVSDCRLLKLMPETFRQLVNTYADFKEQIAIRIAQYDYKQNANIPEDFDEELLPANVAGEDEVGPYQADQKVDQRGKLGPFATADERFVKGGKRLRQFPHVFQIDLTDSGAACLAMICRHFDLNVSLGRIRQIVHTGPKGSNLRSLCRGAEEVGLAARSVQTSLEFLSSMPLPAIVHTTGNQWMVLYDVEGKWVSVADPSQGLRRLKRPVFEAQWSGYAILYDYVAEIAPPRPEAETPRRRKLSFRWMWPLFRPLAGSLLKALALAIVISAMEMLRPVFSQIIVDRVLVGQDRDLLRVIIFAMVGVLVFNLIAIAVQRYLLAFVAVRFDASTLDYITRKLLALPMSYFNTRRVGDIQRRLLGMKQVREFLVASTSSSLANATQLTASLVLMFIYSSKLAFIFVALVPIYVLMMRISQKRLRPIFNELEDAQGAYQSHQIEAIKGIETIKSLSAESTLRALMLNQFHALSRQQFKAYLTSMYYDGAVSATIYISLMLYLAIGAVEVLEGRMTVGALMAFNFLIALANGPIKELLRIWDAYQTVSVLLSRLDDIFEQEPEQGHDHARLVPVKRLEGAISLKNVGFQYGGAESPKILDDITFEIPAGVMVAVVGRSGSGKTTLIKCLAGLLEPTTGNIFFDGMELKTLNYRDLRRQIGFVLQDNYLFNDTIARNIGFGDDEPDMDRVIWAARSANVHQFAERLPSGYETRVGESGLTLSGGQKQRIAIARALYSQPPILIFDEATSALDTESENVIKENLERLMQGRTRFVIAHRLQTIREADMILVLEKGRLAELGTHDELMRQQGIYYYLSSQQIEFE